MILLNSVLNVIHIFSPSFLKMSVTVWKKIVKIQRRFLWRGVKGESMFFGSSGRMFVGRISVRDLQLVNLALLGKWRWRLFSGTYGI